MAGKRFLGKSCKGLCLYSVGQKFCRNHSMLHHFRDKHVLHFTEKFKIAAKMAGKRFMGKSCKGLCLYSVGQKFCRNHYLAPFPR